MILRLVESDLKNIIHSAVKKILNEDFKHNELISRICQRISELQNEIDWNGDEGDLEIPLDNEGNLIAFINYEVEDNRILIPGQISYDRDVPDDTDRIEGDYDVLVTNITLYDENDNEQSIEDNGMIANLLKSFVIPDDEKLDYYEDDDQSGWNESWR